MKITKEMFWKIPQLSRIEYMLVKKEIRDRYNYSITMFCSFLMVCSIGYLMLLMMICYSINSDIVDNIRSLIKLTLTMFTILMIISIIADVIKYIKEKSVNEEIDKRFFYEEDEED